MNDGFDIGVNRQSQDNGIDDQIDPGNCDALGQSTTYEKVLDFTYENGNKEEINLNEDIGLINSCLEICQRRGQRCLAVTLSNERGGRQKCFSHDSSAFLDGTTPVASTGSFYFEKICVSK